MTFRPLFYTMLGASLIVLATKLSQLALACFTRADSALKIPPAPQPKGRPTLSVIACKTDASPEAESAGGVR